MKTTTNSTETVTATTPDGERIRVKLPQNPLWEGREMVGRDIYRLGIWIGPRSKRVIVCEHGGMRWNRGITEPAGIHYYIVSKEELVRLAEDFDEIAELIEDQAEEL